MALILGIQFFHIRVIREIRGSEAFGIYQLRFAWDLEIGIWDFALGFRATNWMKIKEHQSCGHRS
jgi:hypothetical protein